MTIINYHSSLLCVAILLGSVMMHGHQIRYYTQVLNDDGTKSPEDFVHISSLKHRPKHLAFVGIGIHLGTYIEHPIYDPDLTESGMAKIGMSNYRDDLGWSYFAKNPRSSVLPKELAALENFAWRNKKRFHPTFVLTGGDPSYHNGELPTTALAQKQFSEFSGVVAASTAELSPHLEIWNEWNLGTGTRLRRKGSARSYVNLLKAVFPRVKAVAPRALVIAGAVGGDYIDESGGRRYWPWTKEALSVGLLKFADGLSVHLYNICGDDEQRRPAELLKRVVRLEELLKDYHAPPYFPIYITEVGWPDLTSGCGFTIEQQKSYSAQFLLWTAFHRRIAGILLYELKDSRTSSDEIEQKFGLFDRDFKLKEFYCGVREARYIRDNFSPVKLTFDKNIAVATFQSASQDRIRVLWRVSSKFPVTTVRTQSPGRRICSDNKIQIGDHVDINDLPIILED